MIATISCAALMGIDAFKVEFEVDFSRTGMPCFTMVMFQYLQLGSQYGKAWV